MRRVTSGLCLAVLLAGMQAAQADEDYDHGYQSYQQYGSQPGSSNGIAGYNAARDYERQQQMQRDDDARRQQMLRDTPSSTPSGHYQAPRSEVSPAPSEQSTLEQSTRSEVAAQPKRRYARTYRRTAYRYRCGGYRCAPPAAILAPIMFRIVVAHLRRLH